MDNQDLTTGDGTQLSEFINHLFIGILVIAADDRRVLYTNETLQQLLGHVPAVGLPCNEALFGCDTACSFCSLVDHSALEGPVVKYITPMEKYVMVRFFRTMWDGIPALIESVEDVTEREIARKQEQEELTAFRTKYANFQERFHTENLVDTTAKLQEALAVTEQAQLRAEQAAEEAKRQTVIADREREDARKANAAKGEFLSQMSHDMRTPLGAVISLASFGMEEIQNPKAQKYFKEIKDSSKYLLALLNDILQMQKMEYGKIELSMEIVSLDEINRKIETIVRQRAEQKQVELFLQFDHSNQPPRYFRLDPIRTQQILINLLNNAIKYTPTGGRVTWEETITPGSSGRYVVTHTISDTGVGMSQDFQVRMFEPFSKESNDLSKIEGGIGLGLAITKHLVDAMGGQIHCNSEPDVGTTFTISLPYDVPTAEEIAAQEPNKCKSKSTVSLKGKRILLCEDIDINVKIVRHILELEEILVEVAKNGEDGVRMARNESYDAILMDIRMPVMDGLTAAKNIRMFDTKTPIIALSANAYQEDIQKSLAVGMNAHLSKPVRRNSLFETLEDVLKNSL